MLRMMKQTVNDGYGMSFKDGCENEQNVAYKYYKDSTSLVAQPLWCPSRAIFLPGNGGWALWENESLHYVPQQRCEIQVVSLAAAAKLQRAEGRLSAVQKSSCTHCICCKPAGNAGSYRLVSVVADERKETESSLGACGKTHVKLLFHLYGGCLGTANFFFALRISKHVLAARPSILKTAERMIWRRLGGYNGETWEQHGTSNRPVAGDWASASCIQLHLLCAKVGLEWPLSGAPAAFDKYHGTMTCNCLSRALDSWLPLRP